MGSFAALSVTDARGSSAWYRDKLGFTVLREGGSPDGSVRFALLRRENHLLEIVQRSNATAPPAMADRSYQIGLFKLGFWVDRLERLEEQLRQQGVRFSHGIVTPPGSDYRTFAVHDPEGNIVQFFGR